MANDLDEAEAAIRNHNGMDNDDIGALLGRLVRAARATARRLATIEDRLDALESTAAPTQTVVDQSPDPAT